MIARFAAKSLLPEATAIAAFLVLVWAAITIALGLEHRSAEAAGMRASSNLARAFEESTRRTVGQIDQVLLSARAFYASQGPRFSFADWARTQMPSDRMTAAIGIADTSGLVIADTLPFAPGVSIADRPHFIAQLDPAHDDLYISHPVHGRVSGQDTIQFSRKTFGPTGAFAGVVVLSLGCEALSQFYQSLDLGDGFIALLAADGTVLARGPLAPGRIGRPIRNGGPLAAVFATSSATFRFRSGRTGLEQIASSRRLHDYPLIVLVGLDAGGVFQEYAALRRRAIASGAAITVAIGAIGVFWLLQKRRSVASREALTVTLETISQGILMVDAAGHVPVINPRALALLGVDDGAPVIARQQAAARAIRLNGGETPPLPAPPAAAGPAGHDVCFETARGDGTVIEVRSHRLAGGGFVHTYSDVTEQRLADARIRFLAHHDPLTGLANRVQLRQRLPEFLGNAAAAPLLTALVMIDLDGFKDINDTLGHDVGDALLVEVARRLQGLVRQIDFVARLGGDEFVILLSGLRQPEAAVPLVQRALQVLAEPAQVGDHRLRIGASAGVAFHPLDATDRDVLFKFADIALYAAKAAGRGTFRCFDAKMTQAVNERRLLESGLRRALDNAELELHFQPMFDGDSLGVAGFEALTRWRQPDGRYVSPEVFIRIAEECGLINRLGLWVLQEACAAAAAWPRRCRVAVNVSAVQLRDGRLQDDVAAALHRTGLPAGLLEIEVTESVLADHDKAVIDSLNQVRALGVRISLDDFGTGYSSLSYLRRFAFDKIKIDKSFVQGQSHDQGMRVILEAILAMCRSLGLPVVAEGVETWQQLALLQHNHCSELQGYLLGRPLPGGTVPAFLYGGASRVRAAAAPPLVAETEVAR